MRLPSGCVPDLEQTVAFGKQAVGALDGKQRSPEGVLPELPDGFGWAAERLNCSLLAQSLFENSITAFRDVRA